MATVSESTRTPGSVLASQRMDAAIEDAIAERPARYPNGATFVGADMPGLGEILASEAGEGHAVVLVYPDGEEWVIESRKPARAQKPA
ncbi:MAG TPA: hypothetical protein VK756_11525 [Solirubrobacteraceae bacterium]|jgi:hypothetical protein|nr:hypothetical protein [Solirubrobacteraceae bacterium]